MPKGSGAAGELVKDQLAMCAGGIEPRLRQGTEPYPPLSQHRHNVGQIRGTTAQPFSRRSESSYPGARRVALPLQREPYSPSRCNTSGNNSV